MYISGYGFRVILNFDLNTLSELICKVTRIYVTWFYVSKYYKLLYYSNPIY